MKKIITILFIVISQCVHAQNWKEWTQQKKTQLKYLAEQIIAFKTYMKYVEKGYSVAKNGLNAIKNIKQGDFSIHESYFNSLKTVNPRIKNYWKVAEIISLQIKILQVCQRQKKINKEEPFSSDEIDYCSRVINNLLDGCSSIVDQLSTLVTNGKIEMKDDERIKRINALYASMLDRSAFLQHFNTGTNKLAMQKYLDKNDIETSNALFNVK